MGAAAGGMILGAGMDATSAMLSAKMDRRGQKRAMRFAREVGQNKYQWAVEDMRKAGINPILAASAGGIHGSAGPAIGQAPSPKPGGFAATAKEASLIATQKSNMQKQGGVLLSQADANSAQAVNQRELAVKARADTAVSEAQQRFINSQVRQIDAQLPGIQAMENLYRARPELRYLKEFGPAGAAAATILQRAPTSGKSVGEKVESTWEGMKKRLKRAYEGKPSGGGGSSW